MSRSLGCRLPDSIRRHMESDTPPSVAVPLLTVDDGQRPHVALLSYFELAVLGDGCLLWLYSNSSTVRWLTQRPACTLVFASEEGVYYAKGRCTPTGRHDDVTMFGFRIEDVLEDLPTRAEGDTALTSGLTFRMPARVREAKRQLKAAILKQATE